MSTGKKNLYFAVTLLSLLAAAPLFLKDYGLGVGVTAFTFTIAAVSLNLIYGYMGLLSFAQLAFWGIGGYCTALLVMDAGTSFWMALCIASFLNAILALLIGWAALRLQRDSFVIVTLSFSLLAFLVSRDWVTLTRGPLGLPGLPSPRIGDFSFSSLQSMYWLSLLMLTFSLWIIYLLVTSRMGKVFLAIKHNQNLAMAHGISPTPYKLLAFVVSAIFTSIAGGIQVFYLKIVDPSILDFYYLQAWLIMVILGGSGSFWPVVLTSLVMAVLPELLRFSNELRMVIFGVILVAAVLIMPQGIAGWMQQRRIERIKKKNEILKI